MGSPTSSADLGVYVHIPFCERICPYCDFSVEAVGARAAEREVAYVSGLVSELGLWRTRWRGALEGRRLATVYLGGGTPSLFGAEAIGQLLAELAAAFPGPAGEVTLELNPGTSECGRVAEYRAAGVSRLSVGVQSFHEGTLKRLGRAQRAAETRGGLELCLAAGFTSVSVDLIYGAPGQTLEELLQDVDTLIALGVPHVSAYELTLEPGTPFARAHERGHLRLPGEDDVVRMNLALRERLAGAGYEHYEISNFALRGHESRHNLRYWQRQDVLGLGVSAATLLDSHRFRNLGVRRRWQAALAAGRLPHEEEERICDWDARRETLYLGFRRLAGVSLDAYRDRFGSTVERDFSAELEELDGLGLVERKAGRLRLTERGILFADEVFLRFVAG